MLRELTMQNIKGQTGTQQLTGRDIIIGRNGAGKTTRMQTLGLATLGYVPGKGKTVADTFELASADTMVVGLKADDFELSREFQKTTKMDKDGKSDTKISQTITISPSKGEKTNAQREQRVRDELGDFPVMLDFQAFLAMTDNKKRDFIYSLSESEVKWDRFKVERVLADKLIRDELSEEMEEVMASNLRDALDQYKPSASVQDGLLAMKDYAKDQLSYWKKEKIKADGAAKKLTELKNQSEETDRDLAANEERLAELQEERDKIIAFLAEHKAKNGAIIQWKATLQNVRDEIAELTGQDNEGKVKDLQERIETLKKSIDRPDQDFSDALESIQRAKRAAEIEAENLLESIKEDQTAVAVAQQKIDSYSEVIEKINANAGSCAICPGVVCNQDFSSYINELQDAIDDAYFDLDDCTARIMAAQRQVDGYKERIEAAQMQINSITAKSCSRAEEISKNTAELQKAMDELARLQNTTPRLAALRIQEKEILEYLEATPEEYPEKYPKAGEFELHSIENSIRILQETIDEQKKIRNELLNIKTNIVDSKVAAYHVECWKQIADEIGQGGIQGEIVKDLLNPLKEDIDRKLHAIGLDVEFFFLTENEKGREIFNFGWADDKSTRPFESLSQGEQLLLLVAMMTTIIEKNNPPIKVLALDNVNHLDKNNVNRVIKGLNVAGAAMDNIILAGVVEPEETEGWTVWTLGM